MVSRISTRPSTLAVLIGVFELLLGELFKFMSNMASAWHRRKKLHGSGRFRIRANHYLQRPHLYISKSLLVVLLALTIALELTVKPATFPASSRVPLSRNILCFGPQRITRYFDKNGPQTSELDDGRVATYVEQANCKSSLLDLSIQGPLALEQGYPGCLPPFERRRVDLVLAIQGAAVGFVGNSGAGDPHIDYGMERDGEIEAPDAGEKLAGTSFWHVALHSLGRSVSFWSFGPGRSAERIPTNMGIPKRFVDDSPPTFDTESIVNVSCRSNSRECYDSVRPAVLLSSVKPVLQSYVENNLGLLLSSLKNSESSLCIFDSRMDVRVSWVYLNLSIPGVERDGRSGPTVVRMRITGDAQCLSKVPRRSARMYLDSMERVVLNETLNTTQSATFDNLQRVLQKAAVITGMKTTREQGTACEPRGVKNGSTVGTTELIVTAVFSALLLISAVSLLAYSVAAYGTCAIRKDPLDPLWPMQLLVDEAEQAGQRDWLDDGTEAGDGYDLYATPHRWPSEATYGTR